MEDTHLLWKWLQEELCDLSDDAHDHTVRAMTVLHLRRLATLLEAGMDPPVVMRSYNPLPGQE